MKPPPPNALVNKFIALTLVFLIFAGTLGLGAVWVRQEIFSTANRTRALEVEIADVQRRLDEVNAEVAGAEHPSALERQNEAMRLGLVSAGFNQVVRIERDPLLELAAKRSREAMFSGAAAAKNPIFAFNPSNTATAVVR
jgi:hypothetical protein